ncbi:MAG: GreA/GreB family elongation factor [Saonia sp.]
MPENNLKETIYLFCETFINDRLSRIQSQIKEIQLALDSETKSSAGDKHETGRAMLQLEREKTGRQLAEAERMKQVLNKVDTKANSKNIGLGSVVQTTKGHYFLAISAGVFQTDGVHVHCISIQTPIGKLLLGKSVGDSFTFNGSASVILTIA